MQRHRLRAPSPALVISLIALFVALGGTAYAAARLPRNSVGTAQLKKGAVTKKKINKKTIAALRGAQGPRGATGAQGVRGVQGVPGVPGKNGSAVAYAHILANGTLDTAHSKNVSASANPDPGEFCLKVTVPVVNMIATVDLGSGGFSGFATGAVAAQDPTGVIGTVCAAGYNALLLVDASNGTHADLGTWAVFN